MIHTLHTISNQSLQTNKRVNQFLFEQIHFPHQANIHHILRCVTKVHGETAAQTPSTAARNLTSKPD